MEWKISELYNNTDVTTSFNVHVSTQRTVPSTVSTIKYNLLEYLSNSSLMPYLAQCIKGVIDDVLYNEEIESASHFLCHCNYFAMIRTAIWGKPSLHPNDID